MRPLRIPGMGFLRVSGEDAGLVCFQVRQDRQPGSQIAGRGKNKNPNEQRKSG